MKTTEETTVTSNAATWLEAPRWNKAFTPFGHRLNFLSPAQQQMRSGVMRILPPRGEKKRP